MSHHNPQRLGKGLEALIPRAIVADQKTVIEIPTSDIRPNPMQPRTHFAPEAIESLADSIRQHGLAQPVIVRKKDGHYELVAGERRFRASIHAGLQRVPAIVKNLSDRESLQIALIENLERQDLKPLEIARGYKNLATQFEITHDEIAKIFARSRSAVTNTLRLLQLPPSVAPFLEDGTITEGHARVLLSLPTEQAMLSAIEEIRSQNLNVRATESIASTLSKNTKRKNSQKASQETQDPFLDEAAKKLSEALRRPVRIRATKPNGTLEITIKNKADLHRLVSLVTR